MSVIKRESNENIPAASGKPAGTTGSQLSSSETFPTRPLLSLTTGLLLGKDPHELHDLVSFIMGGEASAANTAVKAKDAKRCLEEQLPFLKDIDLTLLYAAYKGKPEKIDEQLNFWVDIQQKKYGATFDVIPYSRWQKRKNSHKL